ncbi:hypothetical protein BDR03DRAFT_388734 [Suillus americanus]|nr:hypothetical protein BDR03DRAFT_388734 [Suillus americanus]
MPSRCTVEESITPNTKYCTFPFNTESMPAIYISISTVCCDVFLVVLPAVTLLMRRFTERRKMWPNTYMVMIARYHVMYFVPYAPLRPMCSKSY